MEGRACDCHRRLVNRSPALIKMMKPNVVITHWVHDEVIQLLELSCNVRPNRSLTTLPRYKILAMAEDADAIMVFMPDLIDTEFLDRCPRLKIVAAALKGFDNIDAEACRRCGVELSIMPDLLTEPTAEFAVALLLAVGRNILTGDRMVRHGDFKGWRPVLYGSGLWGSQVGIVGMGAIGQAIAKRLSGFGCEITYYDPQRLDPEREQYIGVRPLPFAELLQMSRFVVVAVPLTPETLHIIDKRALAMMTRGTYLVNIGRGSVVDEAAVAESLKYGHLAGYAADVFEFEDLARNNRPKCINPGLSGNERQTVLTPHLGSATDAARREIAMAAAENILEALKKDKYLPA